MRAGYEVIQREGCGCGVGGVNLTAPLSSGTSIYRFYLFVMRHVHCLDWARVSLSLWLANAREDALGNDAFGPRVSGGDGGHVPCC